MPEKHFTKFNIKVLETLGVDASYQEIIKAVYNKTAATIILKWRQTESINSKVNGETRMSTPPFI